MIITDWLDVTLEALKDLWQGFIIFVPKLIGALLVFIIGWLIAVIVGKIIAEVLRKLQFNKLFEKGGMREALQKAELKVDASEFIGVIFKWVFVIVFLSVAVEILGLTQFSMFLNSILDYLPNVIVAVLIFVVAVIITDMLEKIVRAAVESVKVGYGGIVAAIVRWSLWIFATFAILYQLNIAKDLIQTLLQGVVWFFVIAGGIAFGWGGKDVASDLLSEIKRKLQK
ncbi:MAG: hypothetical protein WC412_07495 [Candidatus Omnitrophota bacterium]|jgi:hypothetical protein